jgi:hypothetical protein
MQKPNRYRLQNIMTVYFLLKLEWIRTECISILHKALILPAMTYVSPACKFAVKTSLLKMQRLQNKVPHTPGNFRRRTPVRDFQCLSNFHVFITTP